MTLTELRYIAILAEEQHFGRTAARCHVSQPSLSVAVKKLEQELGVELFERSKASVKPTLVGGRIVDQAKVLLGYIEQIKSLASAGRDPIQGPLKLGAIFTMAPYLLPQLIPLLQSMAPSLQLEVQEDFTEGLCKKLRDGLLDVILVSLPFSEPDVVSVELFEEPLVCLAPRDHLLAHKEQITREDLVGQPVLLMGPGHCLRDQIVELLPALADLGHTSSARSLPESNSLEMLRYMVAAGLGVSLVPRSAAQPGMCQAARIVARPLAIPAGQRRLALAWRASFPRHKAIDLLRRAIQTCSGAYWNFTTEPDDNVQSMLLVR